MTGDVPPPISYRPAAEDDVDYYRQEQVWTRCAWRTVGQEPVTDVFVDRS